MSRGVLMASSQSSSSSPITMISRSCFKIPPISRTCTINPSFPKPKSSRIINLRCNSTGFSVVKVFNTTVDAFFLGKAIGEVLIERIESTAADFQEEVMERARRDKAAAAVEVVSSTVKEATDEVKELITSTTQGLITEANSTVEQATLLASTVEHATQEAALGLISEATSTVEHATQLASTVEQATHGLVSEAVSTVEQTASEAQGLLSEATSSAKQAADDAQGLLSEATSTVSDVSKTISSITGSVISEAASSLLKPISEDSFLGFFHKD